MVKKTKTELSTQASDKNIIQAPIELITPPNVLNHFSNYTVVQHDGEHDTFSLSFCEVQKPPFWGSEEEVKAQLNEFIKSGKKIPAICVSRIILNPPHFKRLVAMLQKHVEALENKKPDA